MKTSQVLSDLHSWTCKPYCATTWSATKLNSFPQDHQVLYSIVFHGTLVLKDLVLTWDGFL